jgi:putative glutamine amidotransferase
MNSPLIGVTVSPGTGWRVFPLIALTVRLCGGRAVRWDNAGAVDVDAVDGVIIGGGDDIAPTLAEDGLQIETRIDPARDMLDRWVIEAAFSDGKPVLAIGSGAQRLNTVLGGTTTAATPDLSPRTRMTRRLARIVRSSSLFGILGQTHLPIRATRKVGFGRLGLGLRASAWDGTGEVQAVERDRDPFALGVSWHPEHRPFDKRQRAIIGSVVVAAEAFRAKRAQTRPVAAWEKEFA